MKFNMKFWQQDVINRPLKKAMPVLSFPGIRNLGITVNDLIDSAWYQAECMKIVADNFDTLASVGFMDLSVEAEAFGSKVFKADGEVPTIVGSIIDEDTDLSTIKIPEVGEGRTGINVKSIEVASKFIADRPVFAGNIGPFSLTGRLMDVNEIMIACIEEPELVHRVMDMTTKFLIDYTLAFKEAGANGVLMAEPMGGLLSPNLVGEFVTPYVAQIVEATQDDEFSVFLHNCGGSVAKTCQEMVDTGACGFNFGNSIELAEVLDQIPDTKIVSGNLDPSSVFRYGNPFDVQRATFELLEACGDHKNFIPSSGCDIPPTSSWDNISAFFDACRHYYHMRFLDSMKNDFGLDHAPRH